MKTRKSHAPVQKSEVQKLKIKHETEEERNTVREKDRPHITYENKREEGLKHTSIRNDSSYTDNITQHNLKDS